MYLAHPASERDRQAELGPPQAAALRWTASRQRSPAQSQKLVTVKSAMTTGAPTAKAA